MFTNSCLQTHTADPSATLQSNPVFKFKHGKTHLLNKKTEYNMHDDITKYKTTRSSASYMEKKIFIESYYESLYISHKNKL